MKLIKSAQLRKDFKSYLADGIRPYKVCIGIVTKNGDQGTHSSYLIRNSKSSFPDVYLDQGEYIVFTDNNGRVLGDYLFYNN